MNAIKSLCSNNNIDVSQLKGNHIVRINEVCRKYRREGRFFDEILKEGE